jgi:hypothetical protein
VKAVCVSTSDCVTVVVAHGEKEPATDTPPEAVAETVKKSEAEAESVKVPEAVAIADAEGKPEPDAEPDAVCVPTHRASVAAS